MEAFAQAPATLALIAANVIISLIGFSNRKIFEQNAFWIAPIKEKKQWHRFVTAGFLHVNHLHLFINMYVLYGFGMILEKQILGTSGFLLVYFAALLGGSAWEYVTKKDQPNYRAVGASGATSGTILAFSLFEPFALLLLFFVIPMPAIVLAIGFIWVSYHFAGKQGGMIAHGAHLGGALAGLVMAIFLRPDAVGFLFDEITRVLGG